MSRNWSPEGVAAWKMYELNKERRDQFKTELASRDIVCDKPDSFFAALERAISLFKSDRALAADASPASARSDLRAALDLAYKLNQKLNDLDGVAWSLLSENAESSFLDQKAQTIQPLIQNLEQAMHIADEDFPQKGRLPDRSRLVLAVEVARIVKCHLGFEPTSTRGGLYDAILSLTLEAATNQPANSVHDLARNAIKQLKAQIGVD
ncbi:MAG: hypothetical protein Hals2KO_26420 [Halioglobus sp.]